jgi:hypothetical protein
MFILGIGRCQLLERMKRDHDESLSHDVGFDAQFWDGVVGRLVRRVPLCFGLFVVLLGRFRRRWSRRLRCWSSALPSPTPVLCFNSCGCGLVLRSLFPLADRRRRCHRRVHAGHRWAD